MGFLDKIKSKFKKKKSDDDYDDFDLDEEDDLEPEDGAGAVPAPSQVRDEDDFDDFDDFDDDFDEDGGSKKSGSKKKMMMIAAGVGGLLILGGGGAWFFMGDDEMQSAEGEAAKTVGSRVGLALEQQATGGLTPQGTFGAGGVTGGATGAGVGVGVGVGAAAVGKLTAGGAAQQGRLPQGTAPLTAAVTAGAASSSGVSGGYDPTNSDAPLSTATLADVGINIPAILPNAVADLGAPNPATPLPPADNPDLFERTDSGMLPQIASSGQEPWRTYARPFTGDPNSPLLGLVVTGLGMSASLTQAAIDHLPPEVTLSFSPYAIGISEWVSQARAVGHEVMLELPMETDTFPADDPGPLAMMTGKTPQQNLRNLNLIMASARGYTGILGEQGSRFTKNKKAMAPVLGEIKARGLFFMDPRSTENTVSLEMADQMQLPRAIADLNFNVNASSDELRAQLETLSTLSTTKGVSAALVPASPNTIRAIKNWAADLEGISLAPMTTLAGRQTS